MTAKPWTAQDIRALARQVAKADQTAAISVLKDAIERLQKQLGAYTGRRRSVESGRTFERRLAA